MPPACHLQPLRPGGPGRAAQPIWQQPPSARCAEHRPGPGLTLCPRQKPATWCARSSQYRRLPVRRAGVATASPGDAGPGPPRVATRTPPAVRTGPPRPPTVRYRWLLGDHRWCQVLAEVPVPPVPRGRTAGRPGTPARPKRPQPSPQRPPWPGCPPPRARPDPRTPPRTRSCRTRRQEPGSGHQ